MLLLLLGELHISTPEFISASLFAEFSGVTFLELVHCGNTTGPFHSFFLFSRFILSNLLTPKQDTATEIIFLGIPGS